MRYESDADAALRRRAAYLAGVRARRGQVGTETLEGVRDLVERPDIEDTTYDDALLRAVLSAERRIVSVVSPASQVLEVSNV